MATGFTLLSIVATASAVILAAGLISFGALAGRIPQRAARRR